MRDGTATRQKINRTALELFAKQGVTETTTRDIAAGAGIAEGTIYRHYQSKDELVRTLFLDHYQALGRTLAEVAAAKPGLEEQVAAMIAVFCRLFDEDRPLFTFLLLTQHGQLAAVTEDMITPVSVLTGVVRDAQVRDEIPGEADPDLLTAMVMGLVLQPAVFNIYGRLEGNLALRQDSMSRAALDVLTGHVGSGKASA